MKAALYVRVSTLDQHHENQLAELRQYVAARGWEAQEYIDHGVSGAKEGRPALNRLLADARRRRLNVVVVWSLDRLGRSLRHLVVLLDDLQALGVGFISVREGLDWTTPSGRLQAQLLAMIAEFERARLRERVLAGLARARRLGKRLGRPPRPITTRELQLTNVLSLRAAAQELGVSKSQVERAHKAQAAFENASAVVPSPQRLTSI
jgi:DNA invertase Pin-like site-specific DNA recombinase